VLVLNERFSSAIISEELNGLPIMTSIHATVLSAERFRDQYRFIAADEIGRATRRTMPSAQGTTEEAWSNAASRAKVLRSRVELYLQEQPLHTIALALATGFLLGLLFLFYRLNRKSEPR